MERKKILNVENGKRELQNDIRLSNEEKQELHRALRGNKIQWFQHSAPLVYYVASENNAKKNAQFRGNGRPTSRSRSEERRTTSSCSSTGISSQDIGSDISGIQSYEDTDSSSSSKRSKNQSSKKLAFQKFINKSLSKLSIGASKYRKTKHDGKDYASNDSVNSEDNYKFDDYASNSGNNALHSNVKKKRKKENLQLEKSPYGGESLVYYYSPAKASESTKTIDNEDEDEDSLKIDTTEKNNYCGQLETFKYNRFKKNEKKLEEGGPTPFYLFQRKKIRSTQMTYKEAALCDIKCMEKMRGLKNEPDEECCREKMLLVQGSGRETLNRPPCLPDEYILTQILEKEEDLEEQQKMEEMEGKSKKYVWMNPPGFEEMFSDRDKLLTHIKRKCNTRCEQKNVVMTDVPSNADQMDKARKRAEEDKGKSVC